MSNQTQNRDWDEDSAQEKEQQGGCTPCYSLQDAPHCLRGTARVSWGILSDGCSTCQCKFFFLISFKGKFHNWKHDRWGRCVQLNTICPAGQDSIYTLAQSGIKKNKKTYIYVYIYIWWLYFDISSVPWYKTTMECQQKDEEFFSYPSGYSCVHLKRAKTIANVHLMLFFFVRGRGGWGIRCTWLY